MNNPIQGEFRREFEQMFAACATGNPHIALKDRGQCEKALDLVEAAVRRITARGVPTYIEADDLVQEALMRLPDAIQKYRGKNGASLKTYLNTVIRNDVLDAIKRERREPASGGVELVTEAPDGDDEAEIVNEYGMRASRKDAALAYSRGVAEEREYEAPTGMLLHAAELLTDEQLDVVALCDILGNTQEAAASQLGITRNALASRRRKAHTKLRTAYLKGAGTKTPTTVA